MSFLANPLFTELESLFFRVPEKAATRLETRVLVQALTSADGRLCQQFLEEAGFQVSLCVTPQNLCEELSRGAGVVLLAQEAMWGQGLEMLREQLSNQPRWSDLPLLVVTPSKAKPRELQQTLESLPNVVFVERPLLVSTLRSLVENALRARERQYQVRGYLEQRAKTLRERELLLQSEQVAREEAEAATRAKSQFLANVSHEIRTPMYGILGMTEVLDQTPLSQEQRSSVQTILDCGRSLLELMDDLIDLGKIEAGKLTLEFDSFDPRALLEETLSLFRNQAEGRGIALSGEVAENVPGALSGPSSRVRQIAVNLLNNSLKFTHQGSVGISLLYPKNGLMLEVCDTGVGIPQEKQEEIFHAFAQLDSSASRLHPGAGLGLSIVRHLVSLMGGEIELKSEVGKGTIFKIWLPLKTAEACFANKETLQPQVSEQMKKALRILVADDNPMVARVLCAQVRQLGYGVDHVKNGLEVLDACRKHLYHLVLLDCQMPLMDGYTAAREMNLWGNRPVLIASTAHAMTGEREKCLSIGMDDFMTKPISAKDLEQAIARWCVTALKRRDAS